MKKLLLIAMVLTGFQVNAAATCEDEKGRSLKEKPDVVEKMIVATGKCLLGRQIAESCDVANNYGAQMYSAARKVCLDNFKKNKPSQDYVNILEYMNGLCKAKYDIKGAQYEERFNQIICELQAAEFMVGITQK